MAGSTGRKVFWSEKCLLGHNLSKLFGGKTGRMKGRLIHMHGGDIVNSKG